MEEKNAPREEYEALLSNPCPIALVAVGSCFGFLLDSQGDTFCKARRIAFIQDLVTLPEHRGKRIAAALLSRAKELVVQAGAVSMELLGIQ